MLLICLIVVSVGLALNVGLWGIAANYVIKERNNTIEKFNAYFNQPGPDQPSDFHLLIEKIADLVAERTRIGLMAAERGSKGAAVRDATSGLEQIAADNDPGLAVAQSLPKVLKKNPVAAAGLQFLIQKMLTGQPGGVPGSGGSPDNGSQAKFRL